MTWCVACASEFVIEDTSKKNYSFTVSLILFISYVLMQSLLHCQKLYYLLFLSVFCVPIGQFKMPTPLPVLLAFVRSENLIIQREDVIN